MVNSYGSSSPEYGTYPPAGGYQGGQGAYQGGPGGYGAAPQYQNDAKPTSKGWLNIWELVLVPWLLMVLILVCFLLAGNQGQGLWILIVAPTVLLAICGLFTYSRYLLNRHAEMIFGLLCIIAICSGLVVGVYAQSASLQEYWRLGQGASYFNVLPSEVAGGKSDATTLSFTMGSRIDASRTYGFVDGRSLSGTVYCVAPIMSGSPSESRVEYWAAGVNCCQPRSNFNCGAATNGNAHGGLVLPKEDQSNPKFRDAVSGAEKAYNIQAGDDFLLVQWVENSVDYRGKLWDNAVVLFCVFGGVYLLIMMMIGCGLYPALQNK